MCVCERVGISLCYIGIVREEKAEHNARVLVLICTNVHTHTPQRTAVHTQTPFLAIIIYQYTYTIYARMLYRYSRRSDKQYNLYVCVRCKYIVCDLLYDVYLCIRHRVYAYPHKLFVLSPYFHIGIRIYNIL